MIKWEKLARERGFTILQEDPLITVGDPKAMLEALYKQFNSIEGIASELMVSRHTVRVAFEHFNVPVKTQGGPTRTKLVVTEDLLDEIEANGLTAVAKRLDLDYTTVYKRTRELLRKRKEQREAPEQSSTELQGEKGTPHRGENR